MNEEQFKNRIEERWGHHERRSRHGRVWTGLFLVIVGGLLLLKTANIILFPGWFFTWPMLMIAIGLFSGIRHGFRGPLWIIFLVVGGINLAQNLDPTLQLHRFMWPVIFIFVGLMFILRPKKKHWHRWRHRYDRFHEDRGTDVAGAYDHTGMEAETDSSDFLDVTSVFGGVKKNVLSKNFKGGDIVSFMGGSEIDLTQADFTGKIRIDATNIFGGTKLIVPSSWDVQNDITAVFGGVDDKRQIHGVTMDPNKVLLLDGTCLFGGIEIRSY
jgi:predicted membrane protein